jgi:murein L,D-transpeptidase YcbB/YkuD
MGSSPARSQPSSLKQVELQFDRAEMEQTGKSVAVVAQVHISQRRNFAFAPVVEKMEAVRKVERICDRASLHSPKEPTMATKTTATETMATKKLSTELPTLRYRDGIDYPALADSVKELQQALGITIDGQFGRNTEAKVIEFQKANGLVADGVVGAVTWSALLKSPSKTRL